MEPEIFAIIEAKYNELKTTISGVIMHDLGLDIKNAYHIGHRIDLGRKSVFSQVRVCTNRESFSRLAVKSYCITDAQEINSDITFVKKPGLKLSIILNEIKIMSMLDHPNICKIQEVFLENSYIHIVMELCKGGEIYDHLSANKVFQVDEAFLLFIQILEAVKYLHSLNIVHRALCIENIMFSDREKTKIKIISFGSAEIGEKFTEKYGCALYMAPEVFNENYDCRCDIWSIGVSFYSMLAGHQPFQGKSNNDIIKKINDMELPKGHFWNKVPSEIKKFIKSMIVKEPLRPHASELINSKFLKKFYDKIHEIEFIKTLKILKTPVASEEFLIKVQFSNKIKAIAIKILIKLGAIENIKSFDKIWSKLDSNNTGKISSDTLKSYLKKKYKKIPNLTQNFIEVFKRYDSNMDNTVSQDDFYASLIVLSDRSLALKAFEVLDQDKNGVIGPEDFIRELPEINQQEFTDFFTEAMSKETMNKEDFCLSIRKFSS